MDTPGNDPPSSRRRRSSSKKRRPSSRSNRRRTRSRSRDRSNKRKEEKKSVIDKEDFRELDDVVPPWTKKQSGGGRRRSSSRARSPVNRQLSDPGECCCDPCKCGNGGGTSEYGSENEATFAKKVVRRNVSLKLRPSLAGAYEPEEDTLRDPGPGDWGSPVSRAPPRSKCKKFECTARKVLTKAVEYGVVAGIVVAIYAVVSRYQK